MQREHVGTVPVDRLDSGTRFYLKANGMGRLIKRIKKFDAVAKLLIGREVLRGAEIGVSRGKLSKSLLQHYPKLTLYMVDRWCQPDESDSYYDTDKHSWCTKTEFERYLQTAIRNTDFAGDRRIIIRKHFNEAATEVEDASLDFVFIDCDHSFTGTLGAILAWAPKLKENGIMGGHDWEWPGARSAAMNYARHVGGKAVPGIKQSWAIEYPA